MSNIKKAVILAAGLGTRLKPLTDDAPKCLTEVNGRVLLEHTLDILEKNGIDETAIIIGYLGNIITDRIGPQCRNMKVTYIRNDIYDKTNTMYSTWLARDYLQQGAILIEGDTIFEEALVKKMLQTPPDKACWVGDRFSPVYTGSMSTTDSDNRIIDVKIVKDDLPEYPENCYKSTGVLKIAPDYGRALTRWLEEDISRDDIKIYYDIIISRHLKDAPIYTCNFTGGQWCEIDDMDDLKRAERLFPPGHQ